MAHKIPLFKIYWDEEDVDYVAKVIRNGSNWANGNEIKQFESELAELAGTKYCVTFNSGTSALHALFLAYDIKQGCEVIVPSFTFIATANAALFVGARPVFAEIEGKTYGLDPDDVNEKITPYTKAIMPIHYGGCPCQIKEIKEIADDHELFLFEDAAEALGAKVGISSVGSFGDSSIFSFCQNKLITTGEGGCAVTNSKEIFEKLKLIRSHGRLENSDYFTSVESMDYLSLGHNFRMSTITAALGISQIKKLNKIIKMRVKNAKYMNDELGTLNDVAIPNSLRGSAHVYQMYTIRINKPKQIRNKLMQYLADAGIMCKIYFEPVHLTKFYRKELGYHEGDLPITENISGQVLSLPMYPGLAEKELDYMINTIKQFFGDEQYEE